MERTILTAGLVAGIFVTVLVTVLGWFILFLPFGLIQRILTGVGLWGGGPLRISQTFGFVVVVLVYLNVPMATMILVSSIQSIPHEKIAAAQVLGASTPRIFRTIIIPMTMPGIISSAILVFSMAMSTYLVPVLLMGGRAKLMAITVWRYTNMVLNWPFAAANAVILFALTILITYLFIGLTNRLGRRGKWEMV